MRRIVLSVLCLFVAAERAGATDGVLEINQTCATQSGCFAGDTAGFPVTITAPGAYRLTSNLDLSVDMPHVSINAPYVTLDLNGFEVRGLVSCTSLPPNCTVKAAGEGIVVDATNRHHVVVRNGTVRGTKVQGILLGERATVEDVHVDDIDGRGIEVGDFSTVQRTTVVSTDSHGINLGDASRAIDNVVVATRFDGLLCDDACIVSGNSVANSSSQAIRVFHGAVIRGNTVRDSNAGILASSGALVEKNSITGIQSSYAVSTGAGSLIIDNVIRGNAGGSILCPIPLLPSTVRYGGNVISSNNGTTDSADGDQGILYCLQFGTNHCGTDLSCP